MSCKFPEGSRSYKFCLGCGDKLFCDESTLKTNVEMHSVTLPSDVIPSASKANEMTNHAIDNCATRQLLELSRIIKNAIANGKFSIGEEGSIYPGARKKLEDLGYKVEVSDKYHEPYYNISWKKEE